MLHVVRIFTLAFLVAQMVKNLPTVQETWVQSLGWEGPLEKGKAIHSTIHAWRIPWTEEPGRLQSMGLHRVRHDGTTNTFAVWQYHLTQSLFYIKVLNVSCNLLNTVLDWKPEWLCGWRMVLSVLVVFAHDQMADWEPWPTIMRECHTTCC